VPAFNRFREIAIVTTILVKPINLFGFASKRLPVCGRSKPSHHQNVCGGCHAAYPQRLNQAGRMHKRRSG
jgi:hypothetical protein